MIHPRRFHIVAPRRIVWTGIVLPLLLGGAPLTTSAAEEETPTRQTAALLADFTAQKNKFQQALASAKSDEESNAAQESQPDELDFSRRALRIAKAKPEDSGARDALLWVVSQSASRPPRGERLELERRAMDLLLEHHADDPEVARAGLLLIDAISIDRERFLQGLVDRAKMQETKGLARMALAPYLMCKLTVAEKVQAAGGPAKNIQPDYAETYADLRACDIPATRSKAERLLEEVIRDYGKVALVRSGPFRERDLERGLTLGQVAESRLDEIRNFVIGKPGPAIDGQDLAGAPLKLTDYRGKVVVLVFWASWCGPCMEEVPHERELIARYKGQPFALVGVTWDEDLEAARRAIEANHIDWPNWQDPLTSKSEGPIAKRYHVRSIPAVFVIDAEGILRAKNVRGESLDKAVADLLAETKPVP